MCGRSQTWPAAGVRLVVAASTDGHDCRPFPSHWALPPAPSGSACRWDRPPAPGSGFFLTWELGRLARAARFPVGRRGGHRVGAFGSVHPWLPSPAGSSLTDTPSPRAAHASKGVSVPGPRVQCPTRIRSDQRVVLWSIGTPSPRSLTRPSSDRAADCPDFARAACIRHHAAILSTPAASRGVSPVARRDVGNPVGSPDRALMCEPASHLAPPAPPPSILGPGSH